MPPPKNPSAKPKYVMPKPAPVVSWRNAPGGDESIAVVTKVGRNAISLMLFPPDSRAGVPKESVRHVGDPDLKGQINSDSGAWDFTDETKLLRLLSKAVIPDEEGHVAPITPDQIAFVNRHTK